MTPAKKLFLEKIDLWSFLNTDLHRKPGQYYQRLPENVRNILKDLKSEDLQDIRVDAVPGDRKSVV